MGKITYDDKVTMNENADIPAVNKGRAVDWNEIKNVVNANDDEVQTIIESGTGYIKYWDGTMICYDEETASVNMTSQVGGVYYGVHSFTFPQAFISVPVVIPKVTQSSGVYWAGLGNRGTQTATTMQMRVISGASATNASVTFGYIAIGKWK